MIFIFLIVGIICGGLGIYFYLKPQLTTTKKIDTQTLKANQELHKENVSLTAKQEELNKSIKDLTKSFQEMAENIEKTSQTMYETSKAKAETKMQLAEKEMQEQFKKQQDQLNLDYQMLLEEIKEKKFILQNDIESAKTHLEALQGQVHSAIEAARRLEADENKQKFYCLQLSNTDIEEIKVIRSIIPKLRNAEPVNKIIWKVYYEKPYTDLIGRVVGPNICCGIYKITNIQNKKCYIGQSVNIADRWKQHIRRGLGAEAPTRNKLYSIMAELGPENFTFEIIQKCSREELSERESYWGKFFQANSFGYSEKLG